MNSISDLTKENREQIIKESYLQQIKINKAKFERTKISIHAISLRASSKKEVYRMLQLEADVYLSLLP